MADREHDHDILTSLYRAMGVLECFYKAESLTLNEIVDKTRLPKTSAFRAVKTFVALEYLDYDEETRQYSLSPKLFRLGTMAIQASPLARFAKGSMERIWGQFGEAVYLNIRTADERLCIASLPCTHALQVDMPVGHRSPLYSGATAKVLLSGLADDEIERYLDRTALIKLTEITVVDRGELWTDIRRIREQGYAESHGERIKGVWSVSVPIMNNAGTVIAALSILIPTARAEDIDREIIRNAVIREGYEISRIMGAERRLHR